ncbi:MAG: histidinol dehydrogenase, partial [Thermoleophilaceae bacterium]|nr:histidinol dehydrogenase [Thermoleophilaceae bacterium]
MRIRSFGPDATAADLRALTPPPRDVEADVRDIVEEVRSGGDAAVRRLTERFDKAELAPAELAVPPAEIEAAIGTLEPAVLAGLRTAIGNVRAAAEAQLREPVAVELDAGQTLAIDEVPVRRAAAYVPGGRAPYPSTVVMCAITARAAGVEELAVCAPPGPEGRAHPAILAACGLCEVSEVYRMGGAQAIAALAYGTESVPAVDVIVGPGNRWVTEAKRQVAGVVGIDGLAGPSELVVVAGAGADGELIALDMLAQAEHGPDALVVLISPDDKLVSEVAMKLETLAEQRPSVVAEVVVVVGADDAGSAVRLAEAMAPEHLQLVGAGVEELVPLVRSAGAVFVGRDAGTAFGDYVAGSNHVLPTGGAARFASALSVSTFRRRMARISLPDGAAARL